MSYKNTTQLIGITGITTKTLIPDNEIRVIRGSGYIGSWYYANFSEEGQWYANETPIPGAIYKIFIMTLAYEGKQITFRSENVTSNVIQFYTPDQSYGLIAWFDAFSFNNAGTTNSLKISRWNSKVESEIYLYNGNNSTQPTLSTNNVNGLPTVYARRTGGSSSYNDYLRLSEPTKLPNTNSPVQIFVALYSGYNTAFPSDKSYDYPGINQGLFGWGKGGSYRDIAKNNLNMPSLNTPTGSLSISQGSQPNMYRKNSIITSYFNSSKAELAYNGNNTSTRTISAPLSKASLGYLFRGINSVSTFAGSVQDIIIYNRKLSVDHKQRVEGYIAHKWRMTERLPATHPYKLVAPEAPESPGSENSIFVQPETGTGYAGSLYVANFEDPGQWYADGVAIPGKTDFTFVMEAKYEGQIIEFRTEDATSNQIQMFIPRSIPGLLTQLDAYEPSSFNLSGTQIIDWKSRTNANQASQTTAVSRPVYNAVGLNGKPALVIDGTNDFMNYTNTRLFPSGNTPSHFFSVSQVDTVAAGDRILIQWGGLGDALGRIIWKNGNGRPCMLSCATTYIEAPYSWHGNTLIMSALSASHTNGNTRMELGIDGNTPIVNTASTTPLASSESSTASLFRRPDTNQLYFKGLVQEILCYENELTQPNRQKVEGYLAHKWGLLERLPVNHPYKVNPPHHENIIESNKIGVFSGNGLGGSILFANFNEPGNWCLNGVPIEGETGYYFEMTDEYEGNMITYETETIVSNAHITFDPIFYDGLVTWLDASDLSTLEIDENNFISKWKSKTVNNLEAIQITSGSQPVYAKDGRNELPAVLSNGTGFFNFNDYTKLPQGAVPSHTFIVGYHGGTVTNKYESILTYGSTSTGQGRLIHGKLGAAANLFSSQLGVAYDINSTKTVYDADLISSTMISPNYQQLWTNGDVSTSNLQTTVNTTGSIAYIFKYIDNSTIWDGSVQEIITFNQKLSLTNQQKIEGYLAHKWNLLDILPDEHPYKKFYPTINVSEFDVYTIYLVSGDGGFNSRYFTKMKGGHWYVNGEQTEITTNFIDVTIDMIGSSIYYANNTIQSTTVYIPGIPFDINESNALAADFDASKIDTLTMNSNNLVSAWKSQTTVPDAVQATDAYKVTYNQTGLNGRPTLVGDGVNDYLTITSGFAQEDQTVLVVMKTTDVKGGATWHQCPGIWGSEQSGITTDFGWGLQYGIPMYGGGGASDLTYIGTNVVNTGNPMILGFDRTSSSGVVNHWVNGYANGTNATAITGARTATTTSALFSILNGVLAGRHLEGSISEIVIFDKVLTQEERQKVEGLLAWKWGTVEYLDETHPYKNTMPEQQTKIAVISGSGDVGTIIFSSFTTSGQWYYNGEPIDGETSKIFIITAETTGGNITFVSGSVVSNIINFTEWTPNKLKSNIVYWLDASDESTITKDGSNLVSEWRSKIGNKYAYQTNNTNKPTYNATGRNGLPCVVSNGTNTNMVFNTKDGFPIEGTESFDGQVAYHNNVTHNAWRTMGAWGSMGTRLTRSHNCVTNNHYVAASGDGSDLISNIEWRNQDHIVTSHMNGVGGQLWVDGALTANAAGTYAFNTGTNNMPTLFAPLNLSNSWPGSLQENVVFNRNLSFDEKQKLEGYLAHKWGLTTKLPDGHPYKIYRPYEYIDSDINTIEFEGTYVGIGSILRHSFITDGQWYADGQPIIGETGKTLVIDERIIGTTITFVSGSIVSNEILLSFDPSMLEGATKLWFDASDTSNIILDDSNNVSIWQSKVGSTYGIQATSTSRPSYNSTKRNGLPAVYSAGGKNLMFNKSSELPDLGELSWVFIVAYMDDVNPSDWSGIFVYGNSTAGNARQYGTNNSENIAFSGYSRDMASTVTWRNVDRITAYQTTTGDQKIFIDGSETAAITGTYVLSTTENAPAAIMGNNVNAQYWIGGLQELIVMDRALSLSERQYIEGYLAHKWGLTTKLPSDHPYKTDKPMYIPEAKISLVGNFIGVGSIVKHTFRTAGNWYSNGSPIDGETGYTLTITEDLIDTVITFVSGETISNEITMTAWTPNEFGANVVYWVDASDLSTIIKDGSNRIQQWTSKLGGVYLTQNTDANKPIYNATGRNGLPTVESNGTSQFMTLNNSSTLPIGANDSFAAAVAYRSSTVSSWKGLCRWGVNTTGQGREHITSNASGNVALSGIASAYEVSTTITWYNNDRIVTSHINGTAAEIYVDGSTDASATRTASYNTTAGNLNMFFDGVSNYWPGSAQEYIILNRNLTLTERQKLEGYLAHKWLLTAKLPSGHPYKLIKPML